MTEELDTKDYINEDLLEELIHKILSRNKYTRTGYIHIPIWLIGLALPLLTAMIISYGTITSNQSEVRTELARGTKDIENLYKIKTSNDKSDLIIKRLDDINANLIRIENKIDNHVSKNK